MIYIIGFSKQIPKHGERGEKTNLTVKGRSDGRACKVKRSDVGRSDILLGSNCKSCDSSLTLDIRDSSEFYKITAFPTIMTSFCSVVLPRFLSIGNLVSEFSIKPLTCKNVARVAGDTHIVVFTRD